MSQLRFLRRVNRFPARNETYFDSFSHEALLAASGLEGAAFVNRIHSSWHRPSGDNAVLEENLKSYGDILPNRCHDGDYLAILKKTMDELQPREKIIPLTLGAAMKHSNFPRSTSPGFPWVTQGYKTKGDVVDSKFATGKIHRAWDSIGRGISWSLPDSMAFHRVVASEQTKTKIRPVWGYPTEVIAEEARFFFPLIEAVKHKSNEFDTFLGLGLETALSGHAHIARSFSTPNVKFCLNSDLERFDSHVTAWLIRDIFAFISSWFDFTKVIDSEGKIWNVNPDQTCRRWKSMISYFINTKIRTPTGLRFQKGQGVPSGSMWTNFIDTCANAVQMRTAMYRVVGTLPTKDYYYGDDSVQLMADNLDLDALSFVLRSVFGAILHPEKCSLTDNVDNIHWLGYYHRSGGPARSFDFIVASTLFPDREVKLPIESAARLLGQLYSSMDPVRSVVFFDAVQYLMKTYGFSASELESYVSSLPSKAFKYLQTLGLSLAEIVVPPCFIDPFGDRYIPSVLAKPSPRNFFTTRDLNLPRYAFIAEAYQNRFLRQRMFTHFHLYIQTFSFYDGYELDRDYFSE